MLAQPSHLRAQEVKGKYTVVRAIAASNANERASNNSALDQVPSFAFGIANHSFGFHGNFVLLLLLAYFALLSSTLIPQSVRDGRDMPLTRSFRNSKGHMTGADLRNHNIALPIAAHEGIYAGGTIWDPSPPYSPTRYDSPTNNDYPYPNPGLPYYHQPHASRARQASHASYLGYNVFPNASRTPESAGSLAVGLPHHWHGYQGNLNNSSDSEASYTASMGNFFHNAMAEQVLLAGTLGFSQILTAAERDLMEKDELAVPQGSPRDSLVDLSTNETIHTNEDRYLGAYWLWVHPLWPAVHRPTFNLREASPLLRASMLALGAHALGDFLDKTNARILHERCIKILKKVGAFTTAH